MQYQNILDNIFSLMKNKLKVYNAHCLFFISTHRVLLFAKGKKGVF